MLSSLYKAVRNAVGSLQPGSYVCFVIIVGVAVSFMAASVDAAKYGLLAVVLP